MEVKSEFVRHAILCKEEEKYTDGEGYTVECLIDAALYHSDYEATCAMNSMDVPTDFKVVMINVHLYADIH